MNFYMMQLNMKLFCSQVCLTWRISSLPTRSATSGKSSFRILFLRYLLKAFEQSSLHDKFWLWRKPIISFFRISNIGFTNFELWFVRESLWIGSSPDIFEIWAPRNSFNSKVSSESSAWCAVRMIPGRACLLFSPFPQIRDRSSQSQYSFQRCNSMDILLNYP